MKSSTFLLFLTILMGACQTQSPEEKLREILNRQQPKTQFFAISSDSIHEIKGEKGTVLKIDPKVLRFPDEGMVTGEIEVRLLELRNIEDLLRANTQTRSDDKWLISGGAYQIQMYSNNEELHIADDESISVSFPQITKEKMQLFYGERNENGNLNWEMSNLDLNDRKYPVVIQEDSLFMRFDQRYAIDMVIDTMVYRTPKEKYSIAELQKNFERIDSVILFKDTIKAYIFKPLVPEMVPGDSLRVYNYIPTKKDQFVISLYESISLNKLGWINVDRFYPEIAERTFLELKLDVNLDYYEVYVADSENNTLLNINKTQDIFGFNAPISKRFYIIAFGIKGDQVFGYKKSLVIGKEKEILMKFRKTNSSNIGSYFSIR